MSFEKVTNLTGVWFIPVSMNPVASDLFALILRTPTITISFPVSYATRSTFIIAILFPKIISLKEIDPVFPETRRT